MCGIVGVAFKRDYGFNKKQMDVFSQLLRVNELRGSDSTGVIYATKDKDFHILKEASPASWATHSIMSHELMKDALREGKVLIGHNRAATVGRITDDTAHPFVVENSFAMVHNGTLYGHKGLKDTEVDSEALAHHLQPLLEADNPLAEGFEDEMGKINGAYAIAAYSQKQHKVYLTRNSQRPLDIIETPDAWYWASEGMMLMWILSRNNEASKDMKMHRVKENTLITFDLNKNVMVEEEYVPKKATPQVTRTPVSTGATGKTPTKVVETRGRLSKNEVKRLRRRFLNTRHTFWADDYIETFFPKTVTDGETCLTLMGKLESDEFPSGLDSCHAYIDAEALFGKDWRLKDVFDGPYHGVISEVRYEKSNGTCVFILGEAKPFKKSSVVDTANKIIEDSRSKWTALPAPSVFYTEHPDNMSEEMWKKATLTHVWNFKTGTWTLKNEKAPTVH